MSTLVSMHFAPTPVRRVLCVDDDPAMRRIYATALALPGVALEIVNHGQEAIDRFAGEPAAFDLLVTDHHMPYLGGLALVGRLRTFGYAGAVVVVTGDDSAGLRAAYSLFGVHDILLKPLRVDALRALLSPGRTPVG